MHFSRPGGIYKIVVIIVLGIGILIGLGNLLIKLDTQLTSTRGYGIVGRPGPPWQRAFKILVEIDDFYSQHCQDWPTPQILAENIPSLVVPKNQPYRRFNIYVLSVPRIHQEFLYAPKMSVDNSKLKNIQVRFLPESRSSLWPVVICVKTQGKLADGTYTAYNEYPQSLMEDIGFKQWKEWDFIMMDQGISLIYHIQSDIPPIPGCIANVNILKPIPNKFYYPKEAISAFESIYPDAQIPSNQILRCDSQ